MGRRKLNNAALLAYMEDKAEAGRAEIIELFGGTYEIPSYTKLAESYVATKISQTLAASRDEKGRRNILAKRGKDGTKYINVPLSSDFEALNHIRKRIMNDISGQQESLQKIQLQIDDICNPPPDGGAA